MQNCNNIGKKIEHFRHGLRLVCCICRDCSVFGDQKEYFLFLFLDKKEGFVFVLGFDGLGVLCLFEPANGACKSDHMPTLVSQIQGIYTQMVSLLQTKGSTITNVDG